MKKQDDAIKKLYICRTQHEELVIISKILIEFNDGSFSYVELPSSYARKNQNKKDLERDMLLNEINFDIDYLFDQTNIDSNLLGVGIVFVHPDNLELQEFVEKKIRNIKMLNLKSNENVTILASLFSSATTLTELISTIISPSVVDICLTSLSSMISSIGFFGAAYYNLKSNQLCSEVKSKKENILASKFKLSFSCLMLALNIGFNMTNFNINSDYMKQSIRLSKYLYILEKQDEILFNLDNPFSDNSSFTLNVDEEVDVLMEAFDFNSLLSAKDLEIILSLEKYLEDNPYLDKQVLYEKFASIGIVKFLFDNGSVSGDYSRELNIVGIYDCWGKDKQEYSETMLHELVHATGYLDNYMLNEGMTSLICAEYFSDFKVKNAYCDHVLITKIFCELITPEKMLEAYSNSDMSIIRNEMLKINPNVKDYEMLMLTMQEYGQRFKDTEDFSDFVITNEELIRQMLKLLLPYLESEHLSEETKIQILCYMGYLGQWEVVGDKAYFNISDNFNDLIQNPYIKNKNQR